MRDGLTNEQWSDFVTLATLALMWWVMVWFEVRRTWRWDALGRALTALTVCLGISYTVGAATVLVDYEIWTAPVRWTVRIALFGAGVMTIAVLALDTPEERR